MDFIIFIGFSLDVPVVKPSSYWDISIYLHNLGTPRPRQNHLAALGPVPQEQRDSGMCGRCWLVDKDQRFWIRHIWTDLDLDPLSGHQMHSPMCSMVLEYVYQHLPKKSPTFIGTLWEFNIAIEHSHKNGEISH